MPHWKRFFGTLLGPTLGSIALFPQGLVALGIKLPGSDARLWFLALYLREPWQWPVIVTMIGLGLLAYYVALRKYTTHRRQLSSPSLSTVVSSAKWPPGARHSQS